MEVIYPPFRDWVEFILWIAPITLVIPFCLVCGHHREGQE